MSTVSIVVAVYNVAPYLAACVTSLLAQSHEDLEILLVDDGSTDDSGAICDLYAARDTRVRVIHRPNGGLSAARNSGLRAATGEFVAFLDGDDWIEGDAVSTLLEAAGGQTDLVVAGCHVDIEDALGVVLRHHTRVPAAAVINSGSPSSPLRVDEEFVNLLGYAWNKLYRRSLLVENNLEFEEGLRLVEDVVFNGEVFELAQRVAFIDSAAVHYVQRPRVTLGTPSGPDLVDLRLRAMDAVQGILRRCGVDDQVAQDVRSSMALVTMKLIVLSPKGDAKRAYLIAREMMDGAAYRDVVLSLRAANSTPVRDRLPTLLFRCGAAPILSVAYYLLARLRGVQYFNRGDVPSPQAT